MFAAEEREIFWCCEFLCLSTANKLGWCNIYFLCWSNGWYEENCLEAKFAKLFVWVGMICDSRNFGDVICEEYLYYSNIRLELYAFHPSRRFQLGTKSGLFLVVAKTTIIMNNNYFVEFALKERIYFWVIEYSGKRSRDLASSWIFKKRLSLRILCGCAPRILCGHATGSDCLQNEYGLNGNKISKVQFLDW